MIAPKSECGLSDGRPACVVWCCPRCCCQMSTVLRCWVVWRHANWSCRVRCAVVTTLHWHRLPDINTTASFLLLPVFGLLPMGPHSTHLSASLAFHWKQNDIVEISDGQIKIWILSFCMKVFPLLLLLINTALHIHYITFHRKIIDIYFIISRNISGEKYTLTLWKLFEQRCSFKFLPLLIPLLFVVLEPVPVVWMVVVIVRIWIVSIEVPWIWMESMIWQTRHSSSAAWLRRMLGIILGATWRCRHDPLWLDRPFSKFPVKNSDLGFDSICWTLGTGDEWARRIDSLCIYSYYNRETWWGRESATRDRELIFSFIEWITMQSCCRIRTWGVLSIDL